MLRTAIFRDISENENLDERVLDLRSELIFDSENIELLEELGATLCFQKKTEEAIKVYKEILKHKPPKAEYLGYLGYLYYEQEDYAAAIEMLNKALDLDPEAPFVYFLLGNSYARSGLIMDAIRMYDLAIFLDFDIYLAHIEFAIKYERMGRNKKALKEFIAAYEIDPRDEDLKERIEELTAKVG